MEFILICPTSSQPRFHKRALQLNRIHKTNIFAFQRGLYEENKFSPELDFYKLGKVKDGSYLKRLSTIISAIFKIRMYRNRSNNTDFFFYAMSFDSMLIAILAGLNKGLYEVGDIRFDRKKKSIFSYIESYLIKNIKGVVVTSPSFINLIKTEEHRLAEIPFHVIENKVDKSIVRPIFQNIRNEDSGFRKIKIGLIGFLRYRLPIERLIKFVQENSNKYELHCWGDGECKNIIKENTSKNIFFYGSFRNPDQLEQIYKSIDLSYTVYGGDVATEIGVSTALPNKYYESAFFHVPILCRVNTEVGKKSVKNGIGFMIDIENYEIFQRDLLKIKFKDIIIAKTKCSNINTSELVEDGSKILLNIFQNQL